jgi:hypothetical protein
VTTPSLAGPEAFIWDAERGMLGLKDMLEGAFGFDLSRWQLFAATDISADGRDRLGAGRDRRPERPRARNHPRRCARQCPREALGR